MNTNAPKKALEYETEVASGKFEEMHLYVRKGVADRFRGIANKTKMPMHDLLEEMIETYAYGLGLNKK